MPFAFGDPLIMPLVKPAQIDRYTAMLVELETKALSLKISLVAGPPLEMAFKRCGLALLQTVFSQVLTRRIGERLSGTPELISAEPVYLNLCCS